MASKVKATTTTTAPTTNSNLPKGWRLVRFDELAQMVNERVDPSNTDAEIYVGLEHLDPDSLKLRRWGTPSDVIGDKLQFRKGDIIFGRRRAYQRKLAVAEFDGICSAHAMVVRARNETVDPEFLPFLMQSDLFMQRAIDISVGSLSPTINWSTLRIQEFPLPPKDEQRRIAEILWAADEAKVRFQYAHLAFKKLYECLADSLLGNCPFPRRPLSELCDSGELDIQTGPFGTVLQASSYVKSGTPIINPVNMVKHGLITKDGPFLDDATCERLNKYRMNTQDILLGRKGDVGRAVFVTPEFDGFIVGSDLIRLRLTNSSVEPRYLYHFLLTSQTRSWITRHASGTTMPGINEKLLRSIMIPTPPMRVQLSVLHTFEKLVATEAELADHVSRTSANLVKLINHLTKGL